MTWFVNGVRRVPFAPIMLGDALGRAEMGEHLVQRAAVPFLVLAGAVAALVGLLVPATGLFVLVGVLGLICAVASYLRPPIGLFLFAFMMYGRVSENLTFAFGVPSVAPLLAVFLLSGLVARESIGSLWHSRLVYWIPLIVYGLVQLVSVFVATNQATVVDMVIIYVKEMVFIAVVVLYVHRFSDLRVFVWAIMLAGVFASLITIYQNISGTHFQFYGFGQTSAQIVVPGELEAVPRPSGYVGDPNFFALSLLPLVPLTIHRARYETLAVFRSIAWFSMLALGAAIVMTYSRGAYLALGVVIAGLVWAKFVRARTLVVVALVLLMLLPFLPASYSGRFTSMVNAATAVLGPDTPEAHGTKDSSVDSRMGEVTSGLHMFLDHPILGVGLHNYPDRFQEYVRPLGTKWRIHRSPHSLYVEIAAETGLLGLASFGALVVSLFWWLRKVWSATTASPEMRDLARALAIGLASYLVASVFLHASYPRFLWMLVAGILAVHGLMWEREHRRTVVRLGVVRAVMPLSPVQRQRVRVVAGGMAVALVGFLMIAQLNASMARVGAPLLPRTTHAQEAALPGYSSSVTPTTRATATTGAPSAIPDPSAITTAQLQQASAPATALPGCTYDAETQHNICDDLATFVTENGGAEIFGRPLTEVMPTADAKFQYFENALLVSSKVGIKRIVQIVPLGTAALTRASGGAPGPAAEPLRDDGCVFEAETQQNVCGAFAFFWLSHGGVGILGLPISAEMVDGSTHVQYFENMRLEITGDASESIGTSDGVQFSQLGALDLRDRLGEGQ